MLPCRCNLEVLNELVSTVPVALSTIPRSTDYVVVVECVFLGFRFHVWSLDFGTSTTLATLCNGQDIPLAARDVLVYRGIGFLLLKRVTTGTSTW
jgi:hypothetical protein